MKTHTNSYKENIKKFGRQLDSKIRYTLNGESIELSGEQLNSITPHYQGGILKSVMRQLDIDSNVKIPVGTEVNYQFGVLIGNSYEYIDFGNYIVKDIEKQEDTYSYKITCYDKMLYSMKDYEAMNITYPITIRNYISAICTHLGLTFKNASDTFANYDKEIPNELYLDSEGRSLNYTFRDVLDQLAEVTASTICINENDDELEIRYINNTNDTIDEKYLKDVNVNFGEKFGPVNTIVLSRSAGADNIYYPSVLPENPCEIKISDNLIMNDNNRDTYMPDIYNQLNGLEYYINDFSSTGITYYNLCDRYNVKIGENTYSCVMFNDEVNVTQGLEESVYTDFPEDGETDYKKADKTDRKINQTTLIVDKQNQQIQALITSVEENSEKIDGLEPTEEATGIEELYLPNSAGKDLVEYRLKGKSEQDSYTGKNLFDIKNTSIVSNSLSSSGVTLTFNDDGTIKANGTTTGTYKFIRYYITLPAGTYYFSGCPQGGSLNGYSTIVSNQTTPDHGTGGSFTLTETTTVSFYPIRTGSETVTFNNAIFKPMIAKVQVAYNDFEPYVGGTASPNPDYPQDVKSIGDDGNYIDVVNRGKNLLENTAPTQTINGVTFTVNEDKSILVNGTATNRAQITIGSVDLIANKTYCLYGTPQGLGYNVFLSILGYGNDFGNGVNYTPSQNETKSIILRVDTGASVNNQLFKPMFVEGTTKYSYEPYTTIHNYINLTQPLPSLPDGTADELIIKDGHAKIIQNVGRVVLEGNETWSFVNLTSYMRSYLTIENIDNSFADSTIAPISCNFFTTGSYNSHLIDSITGRSEISQINIFHNIATNNTNFKKWLQEKYNEGNPVIIQYKLAQPVEIDLGEVSIKTIDGNDYLYITDPIKSDMYAKYIRNTTLNDVYYTKTETNSQIKIVKDEIDLAVDKIDDLTPFIDSKTGSNYLHLEKTFASEGAIRSLSIKGFTLFPLYPGMSYPSDTQYPGANSCYKIYFDTIYPVSSTKKTVEIMSPIPLQTATISGVKIQDELLIENNKISVIQNLGYNSSNQLVKLSQSIIHDLGELPIPTLPYDTYITVENYNNDTLSFECEYLQANPYTDIFATQSEMSAKLSITEDNINSKVSKNNIISEINQSAEEVSIDASKITLSGYTSINDSFSVDEQGNFSVESPSSGIYDYNNFDLRIVYAIIMNRLNTDISMLNIYDTDNNDTITAVDYLNIKNYINHIGSFSKEVISSFEFDPTNPKYCISVKNGGKIAASLGSGGVNANVINAENIVCCKADSSTSMTQNPLATLNGDNAEMTFELGNQITTINPNGINTSGTIYADGYRVVEGSGIHRLNDLNSYMEVITATAVKGINWWDSDKKLKDNISDSNVNALNVIKKIRHREYDRTDRVEHSKLGYIAQELQKIDDSLVFKVKQLNGDEILNINQPNLIPYLTKAIQEQQEIIEKMQEQINNLKERIDNYEKN